LVLEAQAMRVVTKVGWRVADQRDLGKKGFSWVE
jgi:hypothetical protein